MKDQSLKIKRQIELLGILLQSQQPLLAVNEKCMLSQQEIRPNIVKRRTEILGKVLDNGESISISDLADIFNCEELTIKRDLQELRSEGINIHSIKGQGVVIESGLDDDQIAEIINDYARVAVMKYSEYKATNLMVRKLSGKAVANFVKIQMAIEENTMIIISYQKNEDTGFEKREVEPHLIFEGDNNWRLLARHDSILKQFLVNQISEVELLTKQFVPMDQEEIKDLFRFSFKGWTGSDQMKIKLLFDASVANIYKHRQILEDQEITENEDGSFIFEGTVNSLFEITSWIVSRGKGVKVLEPEKLKESVIWTAKQALGNY
ncbi:MAG: transcriptional regulator [Melioribacteraceae bacterium]|nr:transcriptional regulator [Melioribacteraceae bacterium]